MRLKYNLNWEIVFGSLLAQAILLFIHNHFYDSYSYVFILYELIFFLIYLGVLDAEFEFFKIKFIQDILIQLIFTVLPLSGIIYIYYTGENFISSTLISLIFLFAFAPLVPSDAENNKTIYWRDRLEKYEKNENNVKH